MRYAVFASSLTYELLESPVASLGFPALSNFEQNQIFQMVKILISAPPHTMCSPKLTHKKFSNIFNCIKSSITPKLFFCKVSFI